MYLVRPPPYHSERKKTVRRPRTTGEKKGEEDDLTEAVWLSQATITRERTEQRKAEFLEYRKMQDGQESGQPRDREKRDWSPVPPGYKPAVMQPGTSLGRADQGHAGREYPQNVNNQESQGSEQRRRYRPEQERKVGLEGPPGLTRLHQDHQGDQGHRGPPLEIGAQGETEEERTDLESAQWRDGTRHRGTNGALPQWQRGINGFIGIPEEEQDSQKPEGIKNKSPPAHESTGWPRVTQTQRRKGKGGSIG